MEDPFATPQLISSHYFAKVGDCKDGSNGMEFKLAKKKGIPARWYNAAIPYGLLVVTLEDRLSYNILICSPGNCDRRAFA